MCLFVFDGATLTSWRRVTPTERRQKFSPVKVRLQLEQLQGNTLVDAARYGELSGYGSHPDPTHLPQNHSDLDRAVVAPVFQERGLLLSLNELAVAVSGAGVFAAGLVPLSTERRTVFFEAGMALAAQLGGIDVLGVKEYLRTQSAQP